MPTPMHCARKPVKCVSGEGRTAKAKKGGRQHGHAVFAGTCRGVETV